MSTDVAPRGMPFGSREELEAALDGRTRPSAEDAARIEALEGLDLRQATYRARDALAIFDDVLLQLQDADFSLAEALADMDEDALTDEHGWAELLHALAALPDEGDELRAVGLVKYRRYLRNRLEMLENRQPPQPSRPAPAAADEAVDPPTLGPEGVELDLELEVDPEPAAGSSDQTVLRRPSTTEQPAGLVLEPMEQGGGTSAASIEDTGDEAAPKRLLRLHRGKPVALAVADRHKVDLWLGRSRFRLLLEPEGPRLVADDRDYGRLRNGRSLVGRSPDCEVVIDARHDTVSRVHLEVEVEHANLVAVTDLSSGGTYVRPELVPRRTNAA